MHSRAKNIVFLLCVVIYFSIAGNSSLPPKVRISTVRADSENAEGPGPANTIEIVDGVKFRTVQAAVDALPFSGGIVFVRTGIGNLSGIELKSHVHLIFDVGTFVDNGVNGGVFVHFAKSVEGASVCGHGSDQTVLRNNSAGKQFGAVVQDEGIDNTVCELTLNANGNTTSTLVTQSSIRSHLHDLKLIHDLSYHPNTNYAWHVRGGISIDASNIEALGGSMDAIFLDANMQWGRIEGGQFSNITATHSPYNGIDITSSGSRYPITGMTWMNIQSVDNGTHRSSGAYSDDEYGITLYAPSANSGLIAENVFENVVLTGNYGSGLRLKGHIDSDMVVGLVSTGNGLDPEALNRNAVDIVSEGAAVATGNFIQGRVRKGNGRYALFTDSGPSMNTYSLDVGADPTSLGSVKDSLFLQPSVGMKPAQVAPIPAP